MNKRCKATVALAICMFGCESTPATFGAGHTPEAISVERIRAGQFRIVNGSTEPLQYIHWLGQGPEPVPYCQYSNGSVSVCSKKVFVDGDELSVHEAYLAPNESVKFSAQSQNAIAVGVSVWLNKKQQYVWSDR
jgi:hypothetical protein